ncbi:hypothetical protein ACVWVY_002736 [Bradyrhizobium sp. URHC0002]
MFWTGFFVGFAACLAIGLTGHVVHDRRQRAAFIASLSPAERERLRGFETVKGDWHEFRDLLQHTHARGAVRNAVGNRCGALSGNMKVSFQAATSIG